MTATSPVPVAAAPGPSGDPVLLTWSAASAEAEYRLRARIAEVVGAGRTTSASLSALADRLAAATDPAHPVRGALVTDGDPADLARLRAPSLSSVRRVDEHSPRPIAFLLPGHGSQYPRMGAELYARGLLAGVVDPFLRAYGPTGPQLRQDWLAEAPHVPIHAPERGQPMLFALDLAIADHLMAGGVHPVAMIGHSVGELAAFAVAGIISLRDAARHLARRSPHYHRAGPGGLLAVAADPDWVAAQLPPGASVGVRNGPRQTLVVGAEEPLQLAQRRLTAAGCAPVRAQIPVPFHSPLMAGLAEQYAEDLADTPLAPPRIRIFSTRTGRRLLDAEAVDPEFLAGQVATPVRFWDALDTLLAERDVLLIETGPGRALTMAARAHPNVATGRCEAVATMPVRAGQLGSELRVLLGARARLWLEGHPFVPSA